MKRERNKSIEISSRRELCERPRDPKGKAKKENNPVVRGEELCPENPGGPIGKTSTIEKEATKIYGAGHQE